MRGVISGLVVVVAMGIAGCGRSPKSEQLAALDGLLKTGLITRQEYDARKADLERKSTMLASLESAYKSGVLTREEYEVKKAALAGADPVPAPSVAEAPPPSQPAATPAPPPAVQATTAAVTPGAPPSAPPAVQAAQPPPQMPPQSQPQPQPQPAAESRPRGNYLVLKKAAVMDQSGFERPMVSFSLLIPSDWQYQGATQWVLKDSCNTIQTTFRAAGPDGRAFEVFPAYNWTWADDPTYLKQGYAQKAQMGYHACDVLPPMGAADFLRRNIGRLRPNAQVVSMEPVPKAIQALQAEARKTEQMAMQYNLRQQVRPDVARARLKYSQNGQAVEEWIVARTIITGTLGQAYNMRTGGMGQSWSYSCEGIMVAERAAQGQLDGNEKLFETIVGTIRVNPEWQARITQNAAQMQQIELKGVRERSAIVTKNAQDIANIQRQGWENKQKSEDHIFGQFSQATLGVETYRNPATGETWDLSNQYGHAWVNDRNEFVLSDQEGWDPNTVLKNSNWHQLEHVKR